ncbi:restriction endonuclease subunit S [Flavobacterium algicola]|uniref:restriction endonuclease subunit S n=1 Tax=Flavobacterium algicola TaxID=556529 RepID=UPI001EFE8A44|nr:restriction endonuclease subunit S [Flavobacterium algicola]MCG9791156.1 restriction endonuclease subunit S [Flavobacterium algicola]
MTHNKLPKDWKLFNLIEIMNNHDGKRKPISKVVRSKRKGEYRYYGATEIVDYIDDYLFDGEYLLIGEDGANLLTKNKDLAFIVSGKFWVNNHAHVLSSKEITTNKYVCNYFNSLNISQFVTGTAQPKLTQGNLNKIKIPLPPLETQHVIVSKIEELFSELDKGIEDLKTAQLQLKTYRQSVLKYAFEGKLTNENVKDGVLPKGWEIVTIGDVCHNVEYGSGTKSKKEGKIPVLRMGNIQNGIFDWSDLVYSDDDLEIEKYLLKKNDVLFNRTNSAELVGKTAIYKGERPAIFAGYLIRLNRKEELIDSAFITYYLNSKEAKKYGNSVRSFGVNQSNINGTKLKSYPLSLPPIKEQHQIVQEIESRLSVADKMEESIVQSLLQAESLRQSILKKSFSGELV